MKRLVCSLLLAAVPFGDDLAETAPQPVVVPIMRR